MAEETARFRVRVAHYPTCESGSQGGLGRGGVDSKELLFNAWKHEANLFNALRSQTVKAHEVPAAVREAAAQHFEKVVRLASG